VGFRKGTLEELVTMFGNAYAKRRVLVTGHTGFKGSWLVLWLEKLGAEVVGLSLEPETSPNHWNLLGAKIESHIVDIRDEQSVRDAVRRARPEIVFHLAAQPLVRRSYRNPIETWHVNVVGTANVLDACRAVPDLAAVVAVSTDKCYANMETSYSYKEDDRLGGHDPYSASKAGSELVVESFRKSYFSTSEGPLLASARAGTVIGGGDWSEDRLIPDLVRAVSSNSVLKIRSPRATRPWQHVLECLSGYLSLGHQLLSGKARFAEPWNFGPDADGNRTVEAVLSLLTKDWPKVRWELSRDIHPHEAKLLQLDCSKAEALLRWKPVWGFETAIAKTAQWYRAWLEDDKLISERQLDEYISRAVEKSLSWTLGANA
jgi:CDP-glucose 4,6-dehydratase